MFVGHFALALAAKRATPRTSLGVLFAACQLSDLLWPVFLLVGWERVRPTASTNPFLNLEFTHYPISHSLLATLGWALLAGLLYRALRGETRGGVVVGLLVLSHWVLDLATHRPDLPLYPGGAKVGLGLWESMAGTLLVEGVMFGTGLWIYHAVTRPRDATGRWAYWTLIAVVLLIYLSSLFSPPPESTRTLAWFAMTGLLLPLWAWWADAHRVSR